MTCNIMVPPGVELAADVSGIRQLLRQAYTIRENSPLISSEVSSNGRIACILRVGKIKTVVDQSSGAGMKFSSSTFAFPPLLLGPLRG